MVREHNMHGCGLSKPPEASILRYVMYLIPMNILGYFWGLLYYFVNLFQGFLFPGHILITGIYGPVVTIQDGGDKPETMATMEC